MYLYTDFSKQYGRIMQFSKNKTEPFHRWYPFVEGYSKEFIQSIIEEVEKSTLICLEPFSGSGTTALELQNLGIECYSFEVNPLMYLIARVKLEKIYKIEAVNKWFEFVCNMRIRNVIVDLKSEFKTLYQDDKKEKWNYNRPVAIAIKKLQYAIEMITDSIYKELFLVALAAILLDVSNLYRNGKCLSYKKNWKDRDITEQEVYQYFDNKVKNELIPDIQDSLNTELQVDNKTKLFNMDSRVGIEEKIADETIDLVITSPPYLNSRDYTDTYMLELRTLGFTNNNKEVRDLREKTVRSHVQIKWKDLTSIHNIKLSETLKKLESAAEKKNVWNKSIIDMIRLYFVDIKKIFNIIYRKLRKGGRVYFNVSNSAYFDVLVNTLEICASIAEDEGYHVLEIREARHLKTSPQIGRASCRERV